MLEDFESVKRWRGGLDPKVADKYCWKFGAWLEWLKEPKLDGEGQPTGELNGGVVAGLNPDELVGFQKVHRDYQVLDKIQDFVRVHGGNRYRSKNWSYSVLRSFFLHNRAELPRDKSFKIRAELPPVKKELTLREYRRILDASEIQRDEETQTSTLR